MLVANKSDRPDHEKKIEAERGRLLAE